MTKKFRMKNKPGKPKRQVYYESIDISDGDTVPKILNEIKKFYGRKVAPEDLIFSITGNYEYEDFKVKWKVPENEEDFQRRVRKYEQKLKEYRRWYQENKDQIEQILKDKKRTKVKRKARKIGSRTKETRKTFRTLRARRE